jgi:hypothetical protein
MKKVDVLVFCDPVSQSLSVRFFRYREHAWKGGSVFTIKKDSKTFKFLEKFVLSFSSPKPNSIWNIESDTAKTYNLIIPEGLENEN